MSCERDQQEERTKGAMALHCEHHVAVASRIAVPSALEALRYSGRVLSSSMIGNSSAVEFQHSHAKKTNPITAKEGQTDHLTSGG